METLLDRAPDDFNELKATKFQVNAARTFANSAILGGSFEPQIKADTGEASYNLEGTLGYAWKLNPIASLGGSVGVGERFQQVSSGGNFPYYVLRVRADIDLSERWDLNVITYRFRNAFNTANDYDTPEISAPLLKIDHSHSVYAKYYYAWKDGSPRQPDRFRLQVQFLNGDGSNSASWSRRPSRRRRICSTRPFTDVKSVKDLERQALAGQRHWLNVNEASPDQEVALAISASALAACWIATLAARAASAGERGENVDAPRRAGHHSKSASAMTGIEAFALPIQKRPLDGGHCPERCRMLTVTKRPSTR